MLGQRRRRWPNIKPALGQSLVFISCCEYELSTKRAWTFGVSEYCFTSLSAQSWQYRDRRTPEVGCMPYSNPVSLSFETQPDRMGQRRRLWTFGRMMNLFDRTWNTRGQSSEAHSRETDSKVFILISNTLYSGSHLRWRYLKWCDEIGLKIDPQHQRDRNALLWCAHVHLFCWNLYI